VPRINGAVVPRASRCRFPRKGFDADLAYAGLAHVLLESADQ